MPRIPTYDTPQADARPLSGVRESSVASPALFGSAAEQQVATGKAMMTAGSGLAAAASVMQDRENADMLFRAESALKDDYLKFDEDVRNNRRGVNSWGLTRDTEQWFAEQEKKHGGTLTNDVQRQLFAQSVAKLRQSATTQMSHFEAEQRRHSLEEAGQSSIVGSINQAAAAAADGFIDAGKQPTPGEDGAPPPATSSPLPGIKRDIINRVQLLANLNGWAPERRQYEEAKHLTNLHKQVIQNLADRDAAKARDYFNANKAEINGGDFDQIDKVLKAGETKQAGFQFVERPDVMKLSTEDQLTAARDFFKDEPEKREAAIHEIKTRAAERETLRRQGESQAADTAWKVIAADGGQNQIPAATWASMSGRDQRHVLDYLAAKARKADGEDKDDIANLDKVERMIEQGDITERGQLSRYDAFFSKSTLKTLANKIDKRGVVAPTDMRREFEERKGAKVNVAKMSENERKEWMAFQSYILDNVRETKRPEDIGVWADRWFMKGYGKDDAWYRPDPGTLGESISKGRKDFVVATPESAQPHVDGALTILAQNGVAMPKDKTLGRDEFYTRYALDAERWAGAHGVQSTPETTAAFALLKQSKKPITPANVDYIIRQFKR